MILARVLGPVVMTAKHPAYYGEKVLAVLPLDENKKPTSQTPIFAFDRAHAGLGDTVLVLREGSGIRQILGRDQGLAIPDAVQTATPVRSLVVAIVDTLNGESL